MGNPWMISILLSFREGVTLALSSAMPGLVGATMRRAGYYSTMRNTITYIERNERNSGKAIIFTVKLFNLLLAGLGPVFLRQGVYMQAPELTRFLMRQPPRFYKECRRATIDGDDQEISSLSRYGRLRGSKWICLVVEAQNDNESGME